MLEVVVVRVSMVGTVGLLGFFFFFFFFFWWLLWDMCGGGVVDRWVAELIFLVVAGERKG